MKSIGSISAALLWAGLASAQPAALFYDPASGPAAFAAGEIRNAHAAKGLPLVEHSLAALPSDSGGVRFVIAAGAAASQRISSGLGVAPLKSGTPQSYSVRRTNANVPRSAKRVAAQIAVGPWSGNREIGGFENAVEIVDGATSTSSNLETQTWTQRRRELIGAIAGPIIYFAWVVAGAALVTVMAPMRS